MSQHAVTWKGDPPIQLEFASTATFHAWQLQLQGHNDE